MQWKYEGSYTLEGHILSTIIFEFLPFFLNVPKSAQTVGISVEQTNGLGSLATEKQTLTNLLLKFMYES